MGNFNPFLNLQNEYVETDIGFGMWSRFVDRAGAARPDKREFKLNAAAPIEVAKKVLRLIDFILCLLMLPMQNAEF
jgi:hypothetical protein